MATTQRPMWFVLVAALALLWNVLGLYSFYVHFTAGPEVIATWPQAQQQIAAAMPRWIFVPFAIATLGGVIGSMRWRAGTTAPPAVTAARSYGRTTLWRGCCIATKG